MKNAKLSAEARKNKILVVSDVEKLFRLTPDTKNTKTSQK